MYIILCNNWYLCFFNLHISLHISLLWANFSFSSVESPKMSLAFTIFLLPRFLSNFNKSNSTICFVKLENKNDFSFCFSQRFLLYLVIGTLYSTRSYLKTIFFNWSHLLIHNNIFTFNWHFIFSLLFYCLCLNLKHFHIFIFKVLLLS